MRNIYLLVSLIQMQIVRNVKQSNVPLGGYVATECLLGAKKTNNSIVLRQWWGGNLLFYG